MSDPGDDVAPAGDSGQAGAPAARHRIKFDKALIGLKLVIPAALVGVVAALLLIALSVAANGVEHVLWTTLPETFGLSGSDRWWIFGMLAVVGLVSGVLIAKLPGHAGPDPATLGLVETPLPLAVMPGIALVVVLSLGGGVSLGPENPIIAINVAVAVWIGSRVWHSSMVVLWMACAIAGTIGALFGTPIAAALVLAEAGSAEGGPTDWDRMFPPLVAAAAGSLTMDMFSQPQFAVNVGTYHSSTWRDLLSAPLIAVVAALTGALMCVAFPHIHGFFKRFPTIWRLTLAGVVLGLLGAVGGSVTLFKGLAQMQDLVGGHHSTGGLVLIVVVKIAALVVAATAGFRGGRVFPSVFIGVGVGLIAHQLVPAVPEPLAVAAAVLGLVLAVTRSGWLALFVAAVVVGQAALVPILCIALLPAWLIVTDRKPMQIPAEQAAPQTAT